MGENEAELVVKGICLVAIIVAICLQCRDAIMHSRLFALMNDKNCLGFVFLDFLQCGYLGSLSKI